MVLAICVNRCCASVGCNGYLNCGRSFVSSQKIALFPIPNTDTLDTVQHLGAMCLQVPVQLGDICLDDFVFVGCTAVGVMWSLLSVGLAMSFNDFNLHLIQVPL